MAGRRRVAARRGGRVEPGPGGRAGESRGRSDPGRRARFRPLLAFDLLLLPLSAYLSFVLRLESFSLDGAPEDWMGVLLLAGLTVVLGPLVFRHFGIYGRSWPAATLDDLGALAGAALAMCALVGVLWWVGSVSPLAGRVLFPRSVPVVHFFLALTAAALPRLATRLQIGRRRVTNGVAPDAVDPPTLGGVPAIRPGERRPVRVEDLLRREPLAADLSAVSAVLRGRRVLVTGAGGSIGSELCRQILRLAPAELVLLGHGEHSIFTLQRELAALLASRPARLRGRIRLHPVIADVYDPERLNAVFQWHRPDVVFHAAAHKHVPLMEQNVTAAAKNNVLGTRNAVAAACLAGAERFVLVSTDKAISPTSVMGATKRAAELVVHHAARQSDGCYLVARCGNVLGSRGSVLRTMEEQIAAGGPVTVTDPRMTRYFLTIPEAAQLLLQAAALGRGGESFIFDMGEPVPILDLAEDLIRRSGLRPGVDIEIVFTGIRPGEKLQEQVRQPGERYLPTAHARIFVAAHAGTAEGLGARLRALEAAVQREDWRTTIRALQGLVPEYTPDAALLGGWAVSTASQLDHAPAAATGVTAALRGNP